MIGDEFWRLQMMAVQGLPDSAVMRVAIHTAARLDDAITSHELYKELQELFDDVVPWPAQSDEQLKEALGGDLDDSATQVSAMSGFSTASRHGTDIPLKYALMNEDKTKIIMETIAEKGQSTKKPKLFSSSASNAGSTASSTVSKAASRIVTLVPDQSVSLVARRNLPEVANPASVGSDKDVNLTPRSTTSTTNRSEVLTGKAISSIASAPPPVPKSMPTPVVVDLTKPKATPPKSSMSQSVTSTSHVRPPPRSGDDRNWPNANASAWNPSRRSVVEPYASAKGKGKSSDKGKGKGTEKGKGKQKSSAPSSSYSTGTSAPRTETRNFSPYVRLDAMDWADDEANNNNVAPRHWAYYAEEVQRHHLNGERYIKGVGFVKDD
jgi:hypothetical protein